MNRESDRNLRAAETGGDDFLYRSIFRSMSEGCAIYRLEYTGRKATDYTVIEINPAYESIMGVTRERAIGSRASVLFPGEDHRCLEFFHRVAESRFPVNFITHFAAKDRYLRISAFLLDEEQVVCICSDITEQQKAEESLLAMKRKLEQSNEELSATVEELEATNEEFEAQNEELILAHQELAQSEAKFMSVFRVAPVGIGILKRRLFDLINNKIGEMTGYREEELRGHSALLLYPSKEEFDRVGRELYSQIAAHGSGTIETKWRCKDGSIIDVIVGASPIEPGDDTFVTFTILDVTKQKRYEADLKKGEAKFRLMIERAPYPMFITDETGNIDYFNDKFTEIFGYNAADIYLTDQWWQLAYPEPAYRAKVRKSWSSAVRKARAENREIDPQEWEVTCRDGSVKIVEFSMVPIGTISLIIMNDLTERKRTQQLLIQNEKMMTVGSLAAGMAHEINNPLGVIMQGAQAILQRLAVDFGHNQEVARKIGIDLELVRRYMEERDVVDYLNGMREAGARAASIVSNMLQFSRRSQTRKVAADIHSLIDYTLQLAASDYDLKKHYDFKNIRIVRRYQPDIPEVYCIITEIEQVILNILKNAAQSMSESTDGDEEPEIVITTRQEDSRIVIEIADNGKGMDEETMHRIFEPFFTTKEVGKGTGLGLSVSYFIICNNHNGTIDVASEPGKGARFTIGLPLEGIQS